MLAHVFRSANAAETSNVEPSDILLSPEEIAELLVLPLDKRSIPYSLAVSDDVIIPPRPLAALELWFADPSHVQIVNDTSSTPGSPIFAEKITSEQVLSVLRHLEIVSQKHVTEQTYAIWSEAKLLVYQELGQKLQQLNKFERRTIFDNLSTQSQVSIAWPLLPKKANAAAFLFIFAPFTDTGATVASKRMRQTADTFDVFTSNQSGRKNVDVSVETICAPYIDEHTVLEVDPAWATYESIVGYSLLAARAVSENISQGKSYDYLYSRAMWVQGIYAGAATHAANPDLQWIVEFSDPLSLGVTGEERRGPKPKGEFFDNLLQSVLNTYGLSSEVAETVFSAAELIAYANADRIIFTNEHQKTLMLARIPSEQLRARVEARASVSNHPTLPLEFYDTYDSPYQLDSTKINLAYFGEFYANRGLQDITQQIRELPEDIRGHFRLHVFTDFVPASNNKSTAKLSKKQQEELAKRTLEGVGAKGIEQQIHINKSLPYLKFLSITKHFDFLIVTDARTSDHHILNPYLPSKWSDYKGSKAKVWALVEEASILSTKPVDLLTHIESSGSIREALLSIYERKQQVLAAGSTSTSGAKTAESKVPQVLGSLQELLFKSSEILGSKTSLAPRLTRFIRTYDQLPQFIDKFLPSASEGSIYRPQGRRALWLALDFEQSDFPLFNQCVVTHLSIEEPFGDDSSEPHGEHVEFPYQLEAPLALSFLAMQISAAARISEVSTVVVPLSPVVGLAGLLASRRLGIKLSLVLDSPKDALKIMNASLSERLSSSTLYLLHTLISEADYIATENDTAVELETTRWISSITSGRHKRYKARRRSRLAVSYIGHGQYKEAFTSLTTLSEINDIHDVSMTIPDILIVDLAQGTERRFELPLGLADTGRAENRINRARKAGTTVILILPDLPHVPNELQQLARIADVVSSNDLEVSTGYFKSKRVTPKVLFSAPSASEVDPYVPSEHVTPWDIFAYGGVTNQPVPVPSNKLLAWDSSRTALRRISLQKYHAGTTSLLSEASWDGIVELAQGHTAIDFAVQIIRSAGFVQEHPRCVESRGRGFHEEIFIRATGKQPTSLQSSGQSTRVQFDDYFYIDAGLSANRSRISHADMSSRGISLILPTYQGASRIMRMLNSIAAQTLPLELLELIVVPNGHPDSTAELVTDWAGRHPNLTVKLVQLKEANVAEARNAGLDLVSREYVTFVDDDDYLGPNYLKSMLVRADSDIVVLGKLNDVFLNNGDSLVGPEISTATSMNKHVAAAGLRLRPLVRSWSALGLNSAKLIPARAAKSIRYDRTLRSAEDQVYMVQLLDRDLQVTGPRNLGDDAYMRVHRGESVSRRPMSLQFSVIERLEAMARFREAAQRSDSTALIYAAKNFSRWHALALVRYANTQLNDQVQINIIRHYIADAGFQTYPEFKSIMA